MSILNHINQKVRSILFFLISLALANNVFAQSNSTKNSIVFNAIDNVAKVYVNDSLIFESKDIAKFDLNLEIDINKYLIDEQSNSVKILLFNTKCSNCMTNPWSISYEIYEDGEFVDFISESGVGGKGVGGEVYCEILDWGNIY